jgi:hypothetical protein
MRWRKDKEDIEVITGYISPLPTSHRQIQIPEYEEDIEPEPKPEPEDISRERKTYGN